MGFDTPDKPICPRWKLLGGELLGFQSGSGACGDGCSSGAMLASAEYWYTPGMEVGM